MIRLLRLWKKMPGLHGYSVMIMQSRDKAELEASNLHLFRKNRVMGLFAAVSIETDDMAPFHKLEELDIPVVFFDRVAEVEGYHKVCLADAEAARIAAEAIIAKKKKSVLALIWSSALKYLKNSLRYFQRNLCKTVTPDKTQR